jgi:hypothetical protein
LANTCKDWEYLHASKHPALFWRPGSARHRASDCRVCSAGAHGHV